MKSLDMKLVEMSFTYSSSGWLPGSFHYTQDLQMDTIDQHGLEVAIQQAMQESARKNIPTELVLGDSTP